LRFTSRSFRQIFKRFVDLDQTGRTPVFPFTPSPLVTGQNATGTFAQGSMVYFQLTTAPNEASVAVRFARGDLSPFLPADQVQIGVFRLP
jgi:hypothetical protein